MEKGKRRMRGALERMYRRRLQCSFHPIIKLIINFLIEKDGWTILAWNRVS